MLNKELQIAVEDAAKEGTSKHNFLFKNVTDARQFPEPTCPSSIVQNLMIWRSGSCNQFFASSCSFSSPSVEVPSFAASSLIAFCSLLVSTRQPS